MRGPQCFLDGKGAAALTRSLYLPIEFRLCEHLGDAVFFEDDRVVATLPAKRTFQFTYYPDLDRFAFKRDARSPEVVLNVQCDRYCSRD